MAVLLPSSVRTMILELEPAAVLGHRLRNLELGDVGRQVDAERHVLVIDEELIELHDDGSLFADVGVGPRHGIPVDGDGSMTLGSGSSQLSAALERFTRTFSGRAAMTCESVAVPLICRPSFAYATISYRPSGNLLKKSAGSSSSNDGSALSKDSCVRPCVRSCPRAAMLSSWPSYRRHGCRACRG